MWSESDTVRFLEEWMRLSKEHPEASRTEVPLNHYSLIYIYFACVENTNDSPNVHESQ